MITYVQGSLFTSPAQTLVNTVNTVGVMGRGIAWQFKSIYPEMFDEYQLRCERGEFAIGQLMLYRTTHKVILNFPTKQHWRGPSQLAFIEAGLRTFSSHYGEYEISSVAFPQLGCGNGELRWEDEIRPLMEQYLANLPIDVFIHIYDAADNTPEHRVPAAVKQWLRGEPRSLAFTEVWDDLKDLIEHDKHNAAMWRIEPVDEGEQLVWLGGGEIVALAKDDLLNLWQQLRSFGYLAMRDLSPAHKRLAQPLFALVAHLGYVEPIHLIVAPAEREQSSVEIQQLLASDSSLGVKLMTPAATAKPDVIQPALFA